MSDLVLVDNPTGVEPYEEGGVPMKEVARLIKEHGSQIAAKLLIEYPSTNTGRVGMTVDPERLISVRYGKDGQVSNIRVFFAPEGFKAEDNPDRSQLESRLMSRFPSVNFIYKKGDFGQMEYRDAWGWYIQGGQGVLQRVSWHI